MELYFEHLFISHSMNSPPGCLFQYCQYRISTQIGTHYIQALNLYPQDLIMIIVRIRLFRILSQSLFLHCNFVLGDTYSYHLSDFHDCLFFLPDVDLYQTTLVFLYNCL